MLRDDDELRRLGSNSRGDSRIAYALRGLGFNRTESVYFCDAGSDVFHIVNKDMALFDRFSRVMARHGVFLEIAVPCIFNFGQLRAFDEAPFFHALNYANLSIRQTPSVLYQERTDDQRPMHWVALHPCKPSSELCQEFMMQINDWPIVGLPWQNCRRRFDSYAPYVVWDCI